MNDKWPDQSAPASGLAADRSICRPVEIAEPRCQASGLEVIGHLLFQLWTLGVAMIAALAGACFAMLSPPAYLDRFTAAIVTVLGILGTSVVVAWFVALRRRPSSWDALGFRRNIVLLVICLAWLFGSVGGLAVFYVIPRLSA